MAALGKRTVGAAIPFRGAFEPLAAGLMAPATILVEALAIAAMIVSAMAIAITVTAVLTVAAERTLAPAIVALRPVEAAILALHGLAAMLLAAVVLGTIMLGPVLVRPIVMWPILALEPVALLPARHRRLRTRAGIVDQVVAFLVAEIIAIHAIHGALAEAVAVFPARLLELLPVGHDDAIVVLGMLEIVLRQYWIAGRGRIAGQRHVFFGDMRRGATDLNVGPIGFEAARERILMLAIAPASAPVLLTLPHWLIGSCLKFPFFPQWRATVPADAARTACRAPRLNVPSLPISLSPTFNAAPDTSFAAFRPPYSPASGQPHPCARTWRHGTFGIR